MNASNKLRLSSKSIKAPKDSGVVFRQNGTHTQVTLPTTSESMMKVGVVLFTLGLALKYLKP